MKKLLKGFCLSAVAVLIIVSCNKEKVFTKSEVTFDELHSKFKKASLSANGTIKSRVGNDNPIDYPPASLNETTVPPILLTEEEAEAIIQPVYDPTANYLLQNYDLNIFDFFQPGDPRIAVAGALAVRLDCLDGRNTYVDTSFIELNPNAYIFNPTTYGSVMAPGEIGTSPGWYDCALRAFGIEAVVGFGQSNLSGAIKSMMKKSALRKMILKIATRSLGIIGAAIAMYEFGDCMDWW